MPDSHGWIDVREGVLLEVLQVMWLLLRWKRRKDVSQTKEKRLETADRRYDMQLVADYIDYNLFVMQEFSLLFVLFKNLTELLVREWHLLDFGSKKQARKCDV